MPVDGKTTAILVLATSDFLVCKNQVVFKNCKKEVCFQWERIKRKFMQQGTVAFISAQRKDILM